MWRVHTCFRYCRNLTTDTQNAGYSVDTRQDCNATSDKSMYCLPSSFPCEYLYIGTEENVVGHDQGTFAFRTTAR